VVHPRDVDAEFAHGRTTNWFGGSSRSSTVPLGGMHYRGLLRVAGRDSGTWVYAVRELAAVEVEHGTAAAAKSDAAIDSAIDALLDALVAKYAPLPAPSLLQLAGRLFRGGIPQWASRRGAALAWLRARASVLSGDGQDWYLPAGDRLRRREAPERVALLAPFGPIVWDRRRFELFWGWAYVSRPTRLRPSASWAHRVLAPTEN